MPPNKPLVIVTRRLPDVIETRMMELFDARLNLVDEAMSQSARARVAGYCEKNDLTDRLSAFFARIEERDQTR